MNILVNIDVPDLEEATSFYTAAFGLEVGRRLGPGVVELLGASAPIYLLLKAPGTAAASGTEERRRFVRHWTPVHLDIVVDDIGSAVERATAAGAVLEGAITTSAWGRLALMSDPFGHGFCLVQFLGRGYDEISEPR